MTLSSIVIKSYLVDVMSEPSKELNAEVKATECIDSSVKDKAEPSSRVEVNLGVVLLQY